MKGNKGGRPAFAPTDKDRFQVVTLAGMGATEADISRLMRISEPTLRKHFAEELAVGHVKANTAVARSLYEQATDRAKPSVAAAIFWLKCRAGWKEDADIGKKESARNSAAAAAGGRFSTGVPPKLTVVTGKAVND